MTDELKIKEDMAWRAIQGVLLVIVITLIGITIYRHFNLNPKIYVKNCEVLNQTDSLRNDSLKNLELNICPPHQVDEIFFENKNCLDFPPFNQFGDSPNNCFVKGNETEKKIYQVIYKEDLTKKWLRNNCGRVYIPSDEKLEVEECLERGQYFEGEYLNNLYSLELSEGEYHCFGVLEEEWYKCVNEQFVRLG